MIIVDVDMPGKCSECPMYDMFMGYCMAATFGCPDRTIKDASIMQSFCPIVGELDLQEMVKRSLKNKVLDPEQEKLNMALARAIIGFDKENQNE